MNDSLTSNQDTEALAWAAKAHEDLATMLESGGGNMLHVRANRALGILFSEVERLEKILYPLGRSATEAVQPITTRCNYPWQHPAGCTCYDNPPKHSPRCGMVIGFDSSKDCTCGTAVEPVAPSSKQQSDSLLRGLARGFAVIFVLLALSAGLLGLFR